MVIHTSLIALNNCYMEIFISLSLHVAIHGSVKVCAWHLQLLKQVAYDKSV